MQKGPLRSIQFLQVVVVVIFLGSLVFSGFENYRLEQLGKKSDETIERAADLTGNIYFLSVLAQRFANTEDPEIYASLGQAIDNGIEDFDTTLEEIRENEEEFSDNTLLQENMANLEESWERYKEILLELRALDPADTATEAILLQGIDRQSSRVHTFAESLEQTSQAREDQSRNDSERALLLVAIVDFIVASIGIGLFTFMGRGLRNLTHTAHDFSLGNLDVRARPQNFTELIELGTTFNTMADNIQKREAELRDLNVNLEKRVAERTEELEKANREVREATRLKDEFLSTMSHELRTPLNAIIGFVGILKMKQALPAEDILMVDRVRANADRLLNLINDILDISRIESGRMELHATPINVREYVGYVTTRMEVLATQKGIGFKVDIADDLPKTVNIDEDALTKILTNLLGNAFKFTEKGEVHLKIYKEAENLLIEVTDTGIGIPVHMHEIIFEKFRQTDGSYRRSYGGSGLGLAIVQSLCVQMGGKIQVKSEQGKGSTFTITLPILAVPTV